MLKNRWTLIVVGSELKDPPSPAVELLQQMIDEGVFFGETLSDRTVVAIVDDGRAGASQFYDAEMERSNKENLCADNMVRLGCPYGLETSERWSADAAKERANLRQCARRRH